MHSPGNPKVLRIPLYLSLLKAPFSLIISTNSASFFFHFNSTEMRNDQNSFLGGLLCIHASFIASISLTYIALGPSEASRCDEKCFFQLSTIFYCYNVLTHASLLHGFLTLVEAANSDGTGGGLAFATCVVATAAVSRLLFACVESMGAFAAVVGLDGTAVHVLGFYLATIH